MELVTAPLLLVLDEPTSGLDSWAAANLLRTCKAVRRGRERSMHGLGLRHVWAKTLVHPHPACPRMQDGFPLEGPAAPQPLGPTRPPCFANRQPLARVAACLCFAHRVYSARAHTKLILLAQPAPTCFVHLRACPPPPQVASRGRIVVLSLHQPSPDLVAALDSLMLLAAGRTAFFGPTAAAERHCAAAGLPCPPGASSRRVR